MKQFAVVFTYSFDQDCAVYLFDTEADAVRFLRDNYEEELRIEREENNQNPIAYMEEDGWYAQIATGDDVIYYHIANVYE